MTNTPNEIEKKILEKDGTLMVIGSVIVMVLVWLTLNVPPKETRKFTKACYEICKQEVREEYKDAEVHFGLRTKFIVSLGECMDDCREMSEAIDEDKKSKSNND